MTGAELVDAVHNRFSNEERATILSWLNLAGSLIYNLEPWTFRRASAAVTVTGGSSIVTFPTGCAHPIQLWREDGEPLRYLSDTEFLNEWEGVTGSVAPCDWTVINGQIVLGGTPDASGSYRLLFLRDWTSLADSSGSVPVLPSAYHWVLVPAAQAFGQADTNDPTLALNDAAVAKGLDGLRTRYLAVKKGQPGQWGGDAAIWDW